MNVYEHCPEMQNGRFVLRLTILHDAQDLLKVYSDNRAVPYFNGDNCHGDDFHYTTIERMTQAVQFWIEAYQKGWFVRWSIVDKFVNETVGTIEGFRRDAEDYFTNCVLLRLDLRSDYEKTDIIENILTLITASSMQLFGCDKIATKCWSFAIERRHALMALGFTESEEPLVGFDGIKYYSYMVYQK